MCDVFLGGGVKIDHMAKKRWAQSSKSAVVLSFVQKVDFGPKPDFGDFGQKFYVKHVKFGPHFQRVGHTLAFGRFSGFRPFWVEIQDLIWSSEGP